MEGLWAMEGLLLLSKAAVDAKSRAFAQESAPESKHAPTSRTTPVHPTEAKNYKKALVRSQETETISLVTKAHPDTEVEGSLQEDRVGEKENDKNGMVTQEVQCSVKDKRPISKKRFACDFPECNETFATKFSWRRHRKKHTGDRPWGCVYCLRYFGEKSTLKKHLHTHPQFHQDKEQAPWFSVVAMNAGTRLLGASPSGKPMIALSLAQMALSQREGLGDQSRLSPPPGGGPVANASTSSSSPSSPTTPTGPSGTFERPNGRADAVSHVSDPSDIANTCAAAANHMASFFELAAMSNNKPGNMSIQVNCATQHTQRSGRAHHPYTRPSPPNAVREIPFPSMETSFGWPFHSAEKEQQNIPVNPLSPFPMHAQGRPYQFPAHANPHLIAELLALNPFAQQHQHQQKHQQQQLRSESLILLDSPQSQQCQTPIHLTSPLPQSCYHMQVPPVLQFPPLETATAALVLQSPNNQSSHNHTTMYDLTRLVNVNHVDTGIVNDGPSGTSLSESAFGPDLEGAEV
eukprot:gb/GEZN01004700.1/.p1 GENE.gb/GEZN01004700.1/~~gb/GEZN01004700.1/.p1  ORF type:complete len:519 (+),score=51.59 gb/GEZN01004700.1/:202-1758(+)